MSKFILRAGSSDRILRAGSSDRLLRSGTFFEDIVPDLVAAFTSDQSEADGWNAQIRDNPTGVTGVRTSANVATLTFPARPGFNITAIETIGGTIPAHTHSAGEVIEATPTFPIDVSVGGGGGTQSPRSMHQHRMRRA